ncbi:MAG: radical SAM protein [Thermoplasmata archaeon]|nr:radical SAM protein [Thermoplasmata archaeon]
MTADPLLRYWRIRAGEAEAKYLLAKRRMVDVDLGMDTETLRRMHDSVMLDGSSTGKTPLLDLKKELSKRMLDDCALCERACHAKRASGMAGHCGVLEPRISSEFLHMGEEPELIPSHTIFFSGCTFDCVYCQNHDISSNPEAGTIVSPELLSRRIEERAYTRDKGLSLTRTSIRSININWVGGDPTPNLSFILDTLSKCEANLPQIWNSNMYLTKHAMQILDGVIDVYLTDFKYGNDDCARRLSNVDRYVAILKRNHIIARRQTEMIVRHLVLPSHIECCTRPVLTWIAENLKGVKVNVMGQYGPAHIARQFPELSRPLSPLEFESAIEIAHDLGLDLCD